MPKRIRENYSPAHLLTTCPNTKVQALAAGKKLLTRFKLMPKIWKNHWHKITKEEGCLEILPSNTSAKRNNLSLSWEKDWKTFTIFIEFGLRRRGGRIWREIKYSSVLYNSCKSVTTIESWWCKIPCRRWMIKRRI